MIRKKLIITPEELERNNLIFRTLTIENKIMATIKGTVKTCHGNVLSGVRINVIRIDNNFNPAVITTIGYVRTDNLGNYTVDVEKKNKVDYILCVV